ncbi:hypothetical protein GJ496_003105 [Pomphorhynchus laevis]|nr:hypothetical protein GJ496_003105 [Pomphorhynchus laevis]
MDSDTGNHICKCTTLHTAVSVIGAKLGGKELLDCEVKWFIDNIVNGSIEQCQVGAFLAAVFIKGMNDSEIAAFTKAMALSGSSLSWDNIEISNKIVDKHSTGGVGDKVSIVLAPVLAACDLYVPSIAGRGLGITGGTIDKLEAIPGMQFEYSAQEIAKLTVDCGLCIVSQSNDINPADKITYAIRDVTSTVASIPLITSSIISKKYCENLSSLLLDVKCGKAAFMDSLDKARDLGHSLQKVGNLLGVKTTVIITQMDDPIGTSIGNAVEVVESIETLKGRGHPDLINLVLDFASQLLLSTGVVSSKENGVLKAMSVINDGSAFNKFLSMLANQGVEKSTLDKLEKGYYSDVFGQYKQKYYAKANSSGFVTSIDALILGKVVQSIGGGRFRKDDKLDYQAGIRLLKHIGDYVEQGEDWCVVEHNLNPEDFNHASEIDDSLVVGETAIKLQRILAIL